MRAKYDIIRRNEKRTDIRLLIRILFCKCASSRRDSCRRGHSRNHRECKEDQNGQSRRGSDGVLGF